MPSACFDAYSNVSTHWKHAEGMSPRYGVAIFGAYERGLQKRGAPPCVGVRLGMGVMCCLFLIYFVLYSEQGVLHQ